MTLDIVQRAGSWPSEAGLWAAQAEAAVFEELDASPKAEIVVLLTEDEEMRKLNQSFRDLDKPTNILSWPSVEYNRAPGGTPIAHAPVEDSLGDLALGYERCALEAEEIGMEAHLKHLIVHGILHLLGYDHNQNKDAEIMENLEVRILNRLNINNPYRQRG